MKMKIIALGALCLLCGMTGVANAATYAFSDMIDYWNLSGTQYGQFQTSSHLWDAVELTENDPLSYTHDITDSVDFAAGDSVTAAQLQLDFTNDDLDTVFTWPFAFMSDTTEYVSYKFDNGAWTYLGEVDDGQYNIGVAVALLNTDGQLKVKIKVSNNDNGNTDAWLDHSLLTGEAFRAETQTAPVPEPGTMLLLGSGLCGIAVVATRRRKA